MSRNYQEPVQQSGGCLACCAGDDSLEMEGFDDEKSRRNFVSKVYTTLCIMLTTTVVTTVIFLSSDEIKEWAESYYYLQFVWMLIFIVVYLILGCCDPVRRSYPINLILLIILTLSMSLMVAHICLNYYPIVILSAFGATALICLLVTLTAKFGPCDVTGCGMIFFIMGMVLMIFGIIAIILAMFTSVKILLLVYSGLAVVLYTLYLLFVTQLILGGRRIEMSADEYILGAILLYTDIIQIFLNLLPVINAIVNRILKKKKRKTLYPAKTSECNHF